MRLCGDQGLVLRFQSVGCLLDRGGSLEILLRRGGEILTLVGGGVNLRGFCGGNRRGGATTSIANILLSLGRVVPNILLCGISGARSVVASELLDLLGLLVDNIGGVGDVVIDELLVGFVNERSHEQDRRGDESKTPQWDDLDQVVGEEGTKESLRLVNAYSGISRIKSYSDGGKDVLCEDDALRLNNEEVNKLMNITSERIKSLLGNSVVLLWANLGSQALTEESLSSNFGSNSYPKCHPCKLEAISEDVEVSGSEDEEDGGEEGNAGGAGVIPRQQAGEERVVVCELLTGCSRLCWSCARSSKVGEFGGGLRMLVLEVLCNGACHTAISIGMTRRIQISLDSYRWSHFG